jgi:hypothetical protein
MRKNEVKVGSVYKVKVSGNIADVRITGENAHGGWDGINVATNRKVRIKSAQRLRGLAPKRPAKRKKIMSLAEYEADATTTATKAKKTAKATTKAKAAKGRHTGERGAMSAGTKRPSGLDAAAEILAKAKEPLGAQEIVQRMLDQGLWRTSGKTPHATVYAAMIREIAAKGTDSRFRKVDRGRFELNS